MASAARSFLRSWAANCNRAVCSATAAVCKPVTGTHVLRVDGYSHLRGMGPNALVQSSEFKVGGHRWHLKLYPNSGLFSNKISASLCLDSYGSPHGVWASKVRLSVLDRLGSPARVVVEDHNVCIRWDKDWGFGNFVTRKELEKAGYVHDDGFAVQCDVTVATVRQEDVGDLA